MEPPLRSFKDLRAWQEAHALVLEVYRISRTFPKEEAFGLTAQIRRAAVSVSSNIAEGFNRSSNKEKVQFYSMAIGSLAEVQNQLEIARDVSYVDTTTFASVSARALTVHKLLNGLIKVTRTRF